MEKEEKKKEAGNDLLWFIRNENWKREGKKKTKKKEDKAVSWMTQEASCHSVQSRQGCSVDQPDSSERYRDAQRNTRLSMVLSRGVLDS